MCDEILRQKPWKFVCMCMEVRLYVPWKFVYMSHGSSLICDMEHRSLHGSCCMRVSVVRDV